MLHIYISAQVLAKVDSLVNMIYATESDFNTPLPTPEETLSGSRSL